MSWLWFCRCLFQHWERIMLSLVFHSIYTSSPILFRFTEFLTKAPQAEMIWWTYIVYSNKGKGHGILEDEKLDECMECIQLSYLALTHTQSALHFLTWFSRCIKSIKYCHWTDCHVWWANVFIKSVTAVQVFFCYATMRAEFDSTTSLPDAEHTAQCTNI